MCELAPLAVNFAPFLCSLRGIFRKHFSKQAALYRKSTGKSRTPHSSPSALSRHYDTFTAWLWDVYVPLLSMSHSPTPTWYLRVIYMGLDRVHGPGSIQPYPTSRYTDDGWIFPISPCIPASAHLSFLLFLPSWHSEMVLPPRGDIIVSFKSSFPTPARTRLGSVLPFLHPSPSSDLVHLVTHMNDSRRDEEFSRRRPRVCTPTHQRACAREWPAVPVSPRGPQGRRWVGRAAVSRMGSIVSFCLKRFSHLLSFIL